MSIRFLKYSDNDHTTIHVPRVFSERYWKETFYLEWKRMDDTLFYAKDVPRETIIND
jgi:hypothetical protein